MSVTSEYLTIWQFYKVWILIYVIMTISIIRQRSHYNIKFDLKWSKIIETNCQPHYNYMGSKILKTILKNNI